MRTIYKYGLEIRDEQTVWAPRFAQWLDVQVQGPQRLVAWALVETDGSPIAWRFRILGTGNPAPTALDGSGYVGTVQIPPFVWHVFQEVAS